MPQRVRACLARRMSRPPLAGLAALAAVAALAVTAPGAAAAVWSTSAMGWLRLANLSPGAPMFDIYLYPVGGTEATPMLRNTGYGMVSSYRQVPAGSYTVAMRKAGAASGSQPVLSTTVAIAGGGTYTLASVGPSSAPRLELLNDMLTPPNGKALVRVIQASLRQRQVTVRVWPQSHPAASAGGHVLVSDLGFGRATTYATVPPGRWNLRASGPTMTATTRETLAAGSSYTLVVLDGPTHLELNCLTDMVGSKVRATGGAPMGFGGTAPRPAPSLVPWLTAMAGGLVIAATGALWLRRIRARGVQA
jgi:hypothetical protein